MTVPEEYIKQLKQKPRQGQRLYCPACPIKSYKKHQILKKFGQKRARKVPMKNPYGNYYECRFCHYGYEA